MPTSLRLEAFIAVPVYAKRLKRLPNLNPPLCARSRQVDCALLAVPFRNSKRKALQPARRRFAESYKVCASASWATQQATRLVH